jgi:hypothetical protein
LIARVLFGDALFNFDVVLFGAWDPSNQSQADLFIEFAKELLKMVDSALKNNMFRLELFYTPFVSKLRPAGF